MDAALEGWFASLEPEGWLACALAILHLSGDARARKRVEAPVHLTDTVPTGLEFAGLALDPALPGRSLLAPLPPPRVPGGANPPIDFIVRWPERAVRPGPYVGRFELATNPGELRPGTMSTEEYGELRGALGLDARTSQAPVPITLALGDAADLRTLCYGAEVNGQ